jgi:isopentenyl diphosphate isomerase/L-lactate dehydrogenase-like FMN-dependent dehydrogenase
MNFSLLLFSNHGGRQVDTTVAAIECLEDIVNVVDGRVEGMFRLRGLNAVGKS